MKKLFTLLVLFFAITSITRAQTYYKRDSTYARTGMAYIATLPVDYTNGSATTCKLNNDGSVYVGISQGFSANANAIIALEKRKANGTRDSSFATNGIASDAYYTGADIISIESINNNKLYCSSTGYGGYVSSSAAAWSTQVYQGYIVAPSKEIVDACKYNDSMVVEIDKNRQILKYRDNGLGGLTNYANSGYWTPTIDIDGDLITDNFNFRHIASVPGSCYYIAGTSNDSIMFIAKFNNSTDALDLSFGDNGFITSYTNPAFTYLGWVDIAVQSDGKILAISNGTGSVGGTVSYAELRRYNTDGTLDNSFNGDGTMNISSPDEYNKVKQMPNGNIATLSSYPDVRITCYDINGEYINAVVVSEPDASGGNYNLIATDFSFNAANDIAVSGRINSIPYSRYFSMKLKAMTCNISSSAINVTDNSVTISLGGEIAFPVELVGATSSSPEPEFGYTINSGNSYTIPETLNENTSYRFYIRDANGCSVTINTTTTSVGINDINLANATMIYPNPTKDLLTIETANAIERIQILSLMGAIVKDEHINSNTISVNELASGSYMIKMIDSKNNIIIKRFTKE